MTVQPIELILIEKGAETSEWADRHERLDAFLSRVRNIPTDEKHTRYILRDADGRILEQHRTIDFFGMRSKASIFVTVEIDWMTRAKEAETELAALKSASAKVIEGFDANVFGRDTTNDHDSGWAIKALPYIAALAHLKMLGMKS